MSSHLAIATVTAALQRTLQASVQMHVEGARITTVSPSEVSKGTPETGVNIFMYQVITNPALHNLDATPIRAKGGAVRRQAALDLYYMLSFYGNNNELTPQRLLGSVVRTLNDRRIITKEMIQEACNDTTFSFLRESTLAEQIQQINIVPLDLSLEDLSKTWSVFFQTPYILSIAYKSLVVLIEGDEVYARSLPVRERQSGSVSPYFARPKVEKVISKAGSTAAIFVDSTLLIQGTQLKGDLTTQIKIFGELVSPADVSKTRIELPLSAIAPESLRAGLQSLEVVHPSTIQNSVGGQSSYQRGNNSEATPFALKPQIVKATVSNIEETDDELCNALVEVELDVIVGIQQKVVLALNEWSLDTSAGDRLTNYMFDLRGASAGLSAPQRTEGRTLFVPINAVKPGRYLLRILIDGAESPLEIDEDKNSSTYEWYVGPSMLIA